MNIKSDSKLHSLATVTVLGQAPNLDRDQLQGLLMPPTKAGFTTEVWLGVLLILCLMVFALWRWRKNQNTPSAIAQRKLHSLMQLQANTPETSQDIALHLVNLLCQGLGVNRLDQYQPQKQSESTKKWDTFHSKLNTACYSAHPDTDIKPLLSEAKRWLINQ